MSEGLEPLFKTIGKALKNSTPEELSEAIRDFQKNKVPNQKEIDAVIEIVANEYSVSLKAIKTGPSRGALKDAKFMSYCLLHMYLNISTQFIAKRIFKNWQNSVGRGISYYRRCDPKIKQDREFLEIYDKLETKLKNA